MKSQPLHPLLNPLITIVCIVGIGYFLVTQKTLLLPLVLGFLFALLLLPAVQRLEKIHVPKILANIIMIVATILVLITIMGALSITLSQFVGDIPNYQVEAKQNIGLIQQMITNVSGISLIDQNSWIDQNINLVEIGLQNVGNVISQATSIASTLGLTFLYTFFMLFYRAKLRIFLQKLLGGEAEKNILNVIKKIGTIVPHYLTGVIKVMLILATLNTLGLWMIGIHNPLFWGIFIAVLNIIPYVGTLVGFIALIIITLITQGIPLAIGAIILFLITQFIDNNILTPKIAGGTININPLAAILGIIIMGSLWGTVGMMLALPLVGIIKVIADGLPEYEAWGYLLGDEKPESPTLLGKQITKLITFKK